jgi:hypothetical protein
MATLQRLMKELNKPEEDPLNQEYQETINNIKTSRVKTQLSGGWSMIRSFASSTVRRTR